VFPLLYGGLVTALPAAAQGTVKIGLIAEFTGPFADYGTQIYNGIKTYLKVHGDTFGGKKVQFVVKDTTGRSPSSPSASRRRDHRSTRSTCSPASA
jgi:ABC-type branched-subunit amino acid transport system substrate-binding protein